MEKIYKYLYSVLENKEKTENPTLPVKEAFLLALDDYYKKRIDLYELSELVRVLWKLEYFTENIEGLDPDLYFAFDLLAYIPPKGKDVRTYKDYVNMIKFIKKFYEENRSTLNKYKGLQHSFHGDLNVKSQSTKLSEKQLEIICKDLSPYYQKAGLNVLMEVAKKAAIDAEKNYKKLPEPKTRSLFSYTAFWIKNAIIFNEYNSNIGKLIKEQEEKNEQYKSAQKKLFEAQVNYFETILPGDHNDALPKDKIPNNEDLWRKIDESILVNTEEEILKNYLPLFTELKPKYVSLVNAFNSLAHARGYKSQLDLKTSEKELSSFTENKEELIKYCQKQIPNIKLPSWYYSQFNRPQNINFIKLLPSLPDIELPDGILDMASREYPILAKFRGRIFFDIDCRDSQAYYEKKTDTFKITVNKNKDRWEQTVELFNSVAKVVGDLGMFEAYWDSESLIKREDVLEFNPYQIEFKLLKQFSPEAFQARLSNILIDIADINFLQEVYKNSNQDLPKVYADALNQCFPDANQTENYTYLIKDHLSFHPFSNLSSTVAQVKILGEFLDK